MWIKLTCAFKSLFGSTVCGAPATERVGNYPMCVEHAELFKKARKS